MTRLLIHRSLDKGSPILYIIPTMNALFAFALIVAVVIMAMPMFAPRAWAAIRVRIQKRKR